MIARSAGARVIAYTNSAVTLYDEDQDRARGGYLGQFTLEVGAVCPVVGDLLSYGGMDHLVTARRIFFSEGMTDGYYHTQTELTVRVLRPTTPPR